MDKPRGWREMLRLRGREQRVRVWTLEEWRTLAEADRPISAFAFGSGWAVVDPMEGEPPSMGAIELAAKATVI